MQIINNIIYEHKINSTNPKKDIKCNCDCANQLINERKKRKKIEKELNKLKQLCETKFTNEIKDIIKARKDNILSNLDNSNE